MEQRRGFLKLVLTACAGVVLAPFRKLLAAEKKSAALTTSAADEKVIRAFYEEGWSRGTRTVLTAHPATASHCAKQFDRFRAAFPDLRISVQSIQKSGDHVLVRWTAEGTHRGAFGGLAPTGRRAHVAGQTSMRMVDGKIVSAVPEWSEGALKNQLGSQAAG